MGTRGPAPKRSDQRRRRNATTGPELDQPEGAAEAPDLAIDDLHPLAVDWYESLADSVEARYFTAAAWQRARIAAHMLNTVLRAGGRPSSQMYAAIQTDMKALMVDPAELRRLNIEVQAAGADLEPAGPTADVIRGRFTSSA